MRLAVWTIDNRGTESLQSAAMFQTLLNHFDLWLWCFSGTMMLSNHEKAMRFFGLKFQRF